MDCNDQKTRAGLRRSLFGDELRRLRVAAGLTREQLAERAGLSPKAISALERGERQQPHPRHPHRPRHCPRFNQHQSGSTDGDAAGAE